ncbi:TrmB family transcriptional regulator [Nanoarchaeota archaeon]
MDVFNALKDIGLTTQESEIYVKLLEIGESTAVKISKETKYHRQTVYDILNQLIKKGLISAIKKNYATHFSAIDPNLLKKFVDVKINALNDALPKLEDLFNQTKEDMQINILKGIEGFNTLIKDIIEQRSELFILGGGMSSWKYLKKIKPTIMRDFKRIKWKMIQVKSKETEEAIEGLENGEIKFIPEEYYGQMATVTYSDRAIIFLVDRDMTFIQIIGEKQAQSFKNNFNIIWKIVKKEIKK